MTQAHVARAAARGLMGIRAPREVGLPEMVRVSQRWSSPGRCSPTRPAAPTRAERRRPLGVDHDRQVIQQHGQVAISQLGIVTRSFPLFGFFRGANEESENLLIT